MKDIDESALNWVDRLGLAWCRLNTLEWDELVGPKPPCFDDLPSEPPRGLIARIKDENWRKHRISKKDYIKPAMDSIVNIIGEANVSRCWWLFAIEESEDSWLTWYSAKCADALFRKTR